MDREWETINRQQTSLAEIQGERRPDDHVAEQFTGTPGVYVRLEETIRGFKEVLEGKHDELPEQAFYMVGTIEGAIEKARQLS